MKKTVLFIWATVMSLTGLLSQGTYICALKDQLSSSSALEARSGRGLQDSTILYGDSIVLKIYPKADSIVIIDPFRNTTKLMGINLIITAQSPTTRNEYFCYAFGGLNGILVEYSYNVRSKLWGLCVTTENSQLKDGMPLWRPFPPLRDLAPVPPQLREPGRVKIPRKNEVRPVMSHGKK